jgi:hypothetical protein
MRSTIGESSIGVDTRLVGEGIANPEPVDGNTLRSVNNGGGRARLIPAPTVTGPLDEPVDIANNDGVDACDTDDDGVVNAGDTGGNPGNDAAILPLRFNNEAMDTLSVVEVAPPSGKAIESSF